MQPSITLDGAALTSNALVWRARAGVPVRAVVKCRGYGWGFEPLIRALEEAVDGYCVADADELAAVRAFTDRPVTVLGRVARDRLAEVLAGGGIPTLSDEDDLETAATWARSAGRPLRIRVGVLPAAGWSGLEIERIADLAPALERAGAEVELWTHVTDPGTAQKLIARFASAERLLRGSGVRVAGTDIASTYTLSPGTAGSAVRIGVGLFGAGDSAVAGLRCAIRLRAPVVGFEAVPAGKPVGYGNSVLTGGGEIVIGRCGYGDGMPNTVAGFDDILSVGMQYVTARAARCTPDRTAVVLLDENGSLDALARRSGRLAHEIVTALGNAARANNVMTEV